MSSADFSKIFSEIFMIHIAAYHSNLQLWRHRCVVAYMSRKPSIDWAWGHTQCSVCLYISDCLMWLPGGGGHSDTEGGRTRVTYFAEEGVFFKTSACPRFCTFLYPGTKYGGQNPLTIHEIYAALTLSDSRSDWACEFAAAKHAEDYKIWS